MDVAVLTTAHLRSPATVIADSQEECWSRLCYAVEEQLPLVVLSGEAEVGKSTLLEQLTRVQGHGHRQLWFPIDATGLTGEEFSQQLSRAVEAPSAASTWDSLADWFDGLAVTRGESVWLFDHVDQAATDLALIVRRFHRLVESAQAHATVILAVRETGSLRALADCVHLWCQLPAWDLASTEKVLRQASAAGKVARPYRPEAVQAVQDCTGGVAGQVHRLSELCQLAAGVRDEREIDVDLVLEVWNELVAPHSVMRAHAH